MARTLLTCDTCNLSGDACRNCANDLQTWLKEAEKRIAELEVALADAEASLAHTIKHGVSAAQVMGSLEVKRA